MPANSREYQRKYIREYKRKRRMEQLVREGKHLKITEMIEDGRA